MVLGNIGGYEKHAAACIFDGVHMVRRPTNGDEDAVWQCRGINGLRDVFNRVTMALRAAKCHEDAGGYVKSTIWAASSTER
jgi:hypothetical protein